VINKYRTDRAVPTDNLDARALSRSRLVSIAGGEGNMLNRNELEVSTDGEGGA
jgi:hypothetical protein